MGQFKYSKEFRADAVRLFRAGNKSAAQLGRELKVSGESIMAWVRCADADEGIGPKDALTTSERAELAALRKRNRELERERDFLQRAAAYFASPKQ